jgi:acyl-CoA thioesterase FadM
MNLWLRLLKVLLIARWQQALELPDGPSVLHFRAWPTDLDVSLHVNNGRYLTLMDLGRLDWMLRAGLWRAVIRHKWTPIASNVLIRFRREMRVFQAFRLETRLVTWDATNVVMEQVFVLEDGPRKGQIAARALFKGGLYDRKSRAFVPIRRLMEEVGAEADAPVPTPEVAAFLAAEDTLRGRAG